MYFNSITKFYDYLDKLGMFHMDLSLNRINNAIENLNLAKTPYPIIQVVGTNGKGSTSTFLSYLATKHGLKTGLYTSPHLVKANERIKINNLALDEDKIPDLAEKVYNASNKSSSSRLTYFEFLTVLGALAFKEEQVDIAIFEAGLGAKHDATSSFKADLVCFTPISLDHENVLGDLEQIAYDKACAMKNGSLAITALQAPNVLNILSKVANEHKSNLAQVNNITLNRYFGKFEDINLKMQGEYQKINALTALSAWEIFCKNNNIALDSDMVREAFSEAFIPARMQLINSSEAELPKTLLLDGAHNEHGLINLKNSLKEHKLKPKFVIFTCMKDKDIASMLSLLDELKQDAKILIPWIDNERAINHKELAEKINAQACTSLKDALNVASNEKLAENEIILICGSLYLMGEFFKLYPKYLN